MKSYIKIFLLFLSVSSLGGCATLFSSKISSITIESDPPSADVKDKDGKMLGTTPYSFTPSKEEKYNFVISKKGFDESELNVRPVVDETALWGDAMGLCIPCIIDIPSKAYLIFPRANYKVDLQRLPDKEKEKGHSLFSNNVYVNINEPKILFKDKDVLGKVNSSTIKYNSDKTYETTGASTSYTDGVCSEFGKFNINSLKCGINRYERDDNSILGPDKQLFIQASVESWSFDLKLKSQNYTGTGNITVKWQVLDPTDDMKVLHESTVSCNAESAGDRHLKYLFLKLLQKSADQFIADDSIYDFINNHHLRTPQLLKGEEVNIDKVKNPSFDKFKDLVSHTTKAVVTIKQKDGFGSGVVISSSGFILTNYHVVDDNKEVTVKFSSGMSLTAKVIKTNSAADLALLKVDAQELTSLPFSTEQTEVGEEVIAIGTPGDLSLEQTVSKGIVSGRRVIEGKNFLQTDVSINRGNSGGPLLNDNGEILGIITMKIVGKGVEGLGFALSTEDVIKLLNLKLN